MTGQWIMAGEEQKQTLDIFLVAHPAKMCYNDIMSLVKKRMVPMIILEA